MQQRSQPGMLCNFIENSIIKENFIPARDLFISIECAFYTVRTSFFDLFLKLFSILFSSLVMLFFHFPDLSPAVMNMGDDPSIFCVSHTPPVMLSPEPPNTRGAERSHHSAPEHPTCNGWVTLTPPLYYIITRIIYVLSRTNRGSFL